MKAKAVFATRWVVMLSLMLAGSLFAQPYPYIEWTRAYGGTGDDVGKSIQITEDGGYIIAGYTNSFSTHGDYNAYLIRTDVVGDTLWTRRYGGDFDQSCNSLQITPEGGYLLAGYTRPSTSGHYQLYLIKTNSVGDMLWNRIYENCSGANSLNPTNDGGYVIAGDSCLMKINANGDSLWTYPFAGNAYCAKQTVDGGYLAAGSKIVHGSNGDFEGVYATKVNSLGQFLWEGEYYFYYYQGGYLNEWEWNRACDFTPTSDGGYLLVGSCGYDIWYTLFYHEYHEDIYLVRVNSTGIRTWEEAFNGGGALYWGNATTVTPTGAYVICGAEEPSNQFSSFYLLRKDAGMLTEWGESYGGNEAHDIEQTSDRGYIIVGNGWGDVYLMKTGPDEPVIRPNIEVSASVLNFGNVPVGMQGELLLIIRSMGDTTLIISDIHTDDSCYYSNFDPADSLLLVGDSLEIAATFSPDEAVAYNNKHLYIVNNDEQVTVTLNGVGTSCISVSSDLFNFGVVRQGNRAQLPLTVHNSCSFTVTLHGLTINNPNFFTDFDPADSLISPGDSLLVQVFFAPQDSAVYSGILSILSSSTPVQIYMCGVGIPCISVSSDSVDFGSVHISFTGQSSLMVYNPSDCASPLILRQLSTNNPNFFAYFDPVDSLIPPGDSLWVHVFFFPEESAVYNGTLTILSSNPSIEVHLHGVGIPNVRLFPSPLNFGYVPLGSQASLPFSIYNISDTMVVLENVFTTDSCFTTDYDPADSLLDVNDSLRIMVTFSPTQVALYLDSVIIESNYESIFARVAGRGYVLGVQGDTHLGIPKSFALESMYPNPFNEATVLWYDVPVQKKVEVVIYDVLGRKAATLVNGEVEAGYHSVLWDAAGMPSGIYFVRMEAGEFQQVRKVVLLK